MSQTARAPPPARWRGPRRPDVQHMIQATHEQNSGVAVAVNPHAASTASSTSSSSFSPRFTTQLAPSHFVTAQASKHFKFGYLSAGFSDPATEAQLGALTLRVNRRPSLMDATRSFDEPNNGAGVADDDGLTRRIEGETQAEKSARAYETAQRDRAASGLGYGTNHPQHYNYLSKLQPPRATESFFGERPCAFPTVELPPITIRPASDLERLPYDAQDAYSRPFKSQIAASLGFSRRSPTYHAYIANTYWRKHPHTEHQ